MPRLTPEYTVRTSTSPSAGAGTSTSLISPAPGRLIQNACARTRAVSPSSNTRKEPDLLFVKVPDGKRGKNRLHLDLRPGDQAAEVARLEGLGARRVDIGQGEQTWVVLADPEGDELCVLRPLPTEAG